MKDERLKMKDNEEMTLCPVCGAVQVVVWRFDATGMLISGKLAHRMQYHCNNCESGSKMYFSPIDLDADEYWGKGVKK